MDLDEMGLRSSELTAEKKSTPVDWNRFPPRFVVRSAISAVLALTFLGLPLLAGLGWLVCWSYSIDRNTMIWIVASVWLLLLIAKVIEKILVVPKRCFVLRRLDFTFRSGWLGREELVVPFSRVQEVETSCNILDRIFRLRSLQLRQPGESESIDGFDPNTVSVLRDYIGQRIKRIVELDSAGRSSSAVSDHQSTRVESPQCQSNEVVIVDSLQQSAEPVWCKFGHVGREFVGRLGSVFLLLLVFMFAGVTLYAWFWKDEGSLSAVIFFSWILFSLRTLIYPFLEVPRRGYALRESDVLIKRGLIATTRSTIPYERIQDVSTSSGFIDRRFGLNTLHIRVASAEPSTTGFVSVRSSGGSSISLNGLGKSEAEGLRTQVLERVSEYRRNLQSEKPLSNDAAGQTVQGN